MQNFLPPQFAYLIDEAISDGYRHPITQTRIGMCANGMYHTNLILDKELIVPDPPLAFIIHLYSSPTIKGYHITTRLMPPT